MQYRSSVLLDQKCCKMSYQAVYFYRPHSEGMGKVMFSQTSVHSHLPGGGGRYPIPGPDWGVPHPRSGQVVPTPGLNEEVPRPRSQVWMGGMPIQDQNGGATPPVKTWWGYPPLSKTGWGTPCPRLDGYPPVLRLDGVSPPSAKQALAMRRAVCLLRSRRRTFLFILSS